MNDGFTVIDSALPSIFECVSSGCKFRFPVLSAEELKTSAVCPRCGSPTILVEISVQPQTRPPSSVNHPSRIHLEVLVDNIRSANNVGSLFRTADGAGVAHLYLCGVTPAPPHPAILKTSLGADKSVHWTQINHSLDLLKAKRDEGYLIWALEGGKEATSIFALDFQAVASPVLLIIGNEISGVDPGLLDYCHQRLWIPMIGLKESLNVSIAFGIAVYTIIYRLKSGFL